jgi:hypothetical protein
MMAPKHKTTKASAQVLCLPCVRSKCGGCGIAIVRAGVCEQCQMWRDLASHSAAAMADIQRARIAAMQKGAAS